MSSTVQYALSSRLMVQSSLHAAFSPHNETPLVLLASCNAQSMLASVSDLAYPTILMKLFDVFMVAHVLGGLEKPPRFNAPLESQPHSGNGSGVLNGNISAYAIVENLSQNDKKHLI